MQKNTIHGQEILRSGIIVLLVISVIVGLNVIISVIG